MDVMESMLKYVVKYVLENAKDEMAFFDKFVEKGLIEKLNKLVNSHFTRITHEEVITILKQANVNGSLLLNTEKILQKNMKNI